MDIRVKTFLEAGMTYKDACQCVVASVKLGDKDGAKVFAEVAHELRKQGKDKDE